MKYVILHVLCEGQTEERFVNEVLTQHLQQFNIFPKPILLLTSKRKNAKGGMLSYVQAKRDLEILIKRFHDNGSEIHLFTTMFDYYALPDDFPGFTESSRIKNVRERISFIENAFSKDLGCRSFIPYLQLHEFEALLFVDISLLAMDYPLSTTGIHKLKVETDRYDDPEMINNSQETAPSKRIIHALQDNYHYNKVKSGAAITSLIGIDPLIANCQHFREWLERIKDTIP